MKVQGQMHGSPSRMTNEGRDDKCEVYEHFRRVQEDGQWLVRRSLPLSSRRMWGLGGRRWRASSRRSAGMKRRMVGLDDHWFWSCLVVRKMGGVGEGAAELHGGGAAVDEVDLAAEVEGDGRAEGLVAEEEDLVGAGDGGGLLQVEDVLGERMRLERMGAKRAKARWAAIRKRAEVKAMVVVAARWRRCIRRAQARAGPVAKARAASKAGRRRAAKAGSGEVEEVGGGEGVAADVAVGEEGAEVGGGGDGGGIARPEKEGER